MNTALRNRPPRIARKISIDDFIQGAEPPDDERNRLSALLQMLPSEAKGDGDNDVDLVSVIMVGLGDQFRSRARDYQERYAAAVAEWEAWDVPGDEWSEKHKAKLDELEKKYDLAGALCEETQFKIVEVEQSSPI